MFNVLALGATAFGMIRVARKLRGSTLWTDAFFPLALLQLGQSENLLHAFQIVFVISAVLLNNILIVIAGHRSSLTFRLGSRGNLPYPLAALRCTGTDPGPAAVLVAPLCRCATLDLQRPSVQGNKRMDDHFLCTFTLVVSTLLPRLLETPSPPTV